MADAAAPPLTHLITFVRPGHAKATLSELESLGYPVIRAATAEVVAAKLSALPSLLLVDEANWLTLLETHDELMRKQTGNGQLRVFLLTDEPPASGEEVDVTTVPSPDLVRVALHAEASAADAIEHLHRHVWLSRRLSPRIDVSLPATFQLDDGTALTGTLRNLSENGAGLRFNPMPNELASGLLSFDGVSQRIEVRATVANRRPSENSVGLKFDAGLAGQGGALRRLIDQLRNPTQPDNDRRVMVYDDTSALMLRALQHTLTQHGFQVATSQRVSDFAQQLSQAPFNLVVFDHSSPALRVERMPELRRRMGNASLVLFSNAAEDALKAAVAPYGAADALRKGTFSDLFIDRVSELLK